MNECKKCVKVPGIIADEECWQIPRRGNGTCDHIVHYARCEEHKGIPNPLNEEV